MTIRTILHATALPILDAELLLAHTLGKTREFLHTHPDTKLTTEEEQEFAKLVARRTKHEPIAYLINNKAFYKRDFFVDKRVHIPRPETEDMINILLKHVPTNFNGVIADICTGSGCIAITLACELPNARIIATDISKDAIAIAQQNAKTHGIASRIDFRLGNLLEPITEQVNVVISNPPYGWINGWTNDAEVRFQPSISYESGADGLSAIRALLSDVPRILQKGQAFIEYDPRQTKKLSYLIPHTLHHRIYKDLSGFNRVVHLTQ